MIKFVDNTNDTNGCIDFEFDSKKDTVKLSIFFTSQDVPVSRVYVYQESITNFINHSEFDNSIRILIDKAKEEYDADNHREELLSSVKKNIAQYQSGITLD